MIMNIKYIKENYHFETLNEKHDLSKFICDSEDLTNFLKNDALNQQKEKLNVTKLVICDNEIIGYVSLLTDTIVLKNIKENEIRKIIKSKLNTTNKKRLIPAIKIGRFAINKKYSNKGLGTYILYNVLREINKISKEVIGVRFVVVEGYAPVLNFYKKIGFVNLKKDESKMNKINKIIERNPKKTFYLYSDLKKLI